MVTMFPQEELVKKSGDEAQITKTKSCFKSAASKAKKSSVTFHESVKVTSDKLGVKSSVLLKSFKSYLNEASDKRMLSILKAGQSLSLVFVWDGTGSMNMGNVFTAVRRTIRDILHSLKTNLRYLTFEIGCVIYRDVGDGHLRFQKFEMDASENCVENFKVFINSIESQGGQDQCEDVIGGLAEAANMTCTKVNKVLILCGDAPCHGSSYHNGCGDYYTDGNFTGSKVSSAIINDLQQKDFNVVFWKVNDTTDRMIQKFNEEAGRNFIETCQLDTTDMNFLQKTIKKSIRSTVSRSISESVALAETAPSTRCDHAIERLEKTIQICEAAEDETGDSATVTFRP